MNVKKLTVMSEPHRKVPSLVIPPLSGEGTSGTLISGRNNNLLTSGNSPMITKPGIKIAALSKLVYQLKCNALPFTTSRDFLITTE